MRIALRDVNEKGVEIGECQNRCHDDISIIKVLQGSEAPLLGRLLPLAIFLSHNI